MDKPAKLVANLCANDKRGGDPMESDRHGRIARKIFDANRNRERFRPLREDDEPESLEAAYIIQDKVHRLLQTEGDMGPIGGHKIALTSAAIQELCGVTQPVYGSIFTKTIRRSPCVLKLSEFMRLGLEFEVAFEIARDVMADGAPYDTHSIGEYVHSCMPAFELIDDRSADYSDLDAASILTDRCWCGGIVLGQPVMDWRDLDLARTPVNLRWNGDTVDEAVTGDALGHPLAGLAWVANHLASRGRMLRQGEVVMTGSALKTRFAKPGDAVVYSIEGVGEVSLRVET